MIDPLATLPAHEPLAPGATIRSSFDELAPPFPPGEGPAALERVRDGTWPAPGSTSLLAQVTTDHPAAPAAPHWIGYEFEFGRTLERVVFQEGVPQADGGWFETLALEVRTAPDGPWQPVPDATLTPMYRSFGPTSLSYESYVFDLEPRVVDALRVVGVPGGSAGFASFGELEALGPVWDPELCGVESYGEEVPLHTTELRCLTPPVPGYPGRFEVRAAPPSAPSALVIAGAPGNTPVGAASLLVDLTSAQHLPLLVDEQGTGSLGYLLPAVPELSGVELFLQVVSHDPDVFASLRMSNALWIHTCP
jgi:hypothetical protein